MDIVVGTYILIGLFGGCGLFVVLKTMSDYIIKGVLKHMEMRGVFDPPHEPDIDEIIETWSSNLPIIDNPWSNSTEMSLDSALLDRVLNSDSYSLAASADDCTNNQWDGVTVRTDIVRCHENVVGEAVMKMKRWERENGFNNLV